MRATGPHAAGPGVAREPDGALDVCGAVPLLAGELAFAVVFNHDETELCGRSDRRCRRNPCASSLTSLSRPVRPSD
jgi:hypothetical protein